MVIGWILCDYNFVDAVTWDMAFSLAISWNSWNLVDILWFILRNFSAQLMAQLFSPVETFLEVSPRCSR